MKKILSILLKVKVAIIAIYVAFLAISIPLFIDKIEKPVKTEASQIAKRNELKGRSPKDYGFEHKTVTFPSTDGVTISGWLIEAEQKTDKCILYVHGWNSSAMSGLKFLDMLRESNLHQDHHIFFIDLRTSGNSTGERTDLGLKPSYDVFHAIEHLNQNFNINRFTLFGKSMGAMAISLMLYRERENLENMGIKIDRIIFDSPLTNVESAIRAFPSGVEFLGELLYTPFLFFLNRRWDNMLDKMALSHLITNFKDIDLLILQYNQDDLTKTDKLKMELEESSINAKLQIFDKGFHGQIFNQNREKYIEHFVDFVRSGEE